VGGRRCSSSWSSSGDWPRTTATSSRYYRSRPAASGGFRGIGHPFTVLQFDDEDLPDSLYLEDGQKRSTSTEEPDLLKDFLEMFNELRSISLPPNEFGKFLDGIERTRFPVPES
jgi:hypothetical protein